MAIGLYIHVPFCKSKCPYCDFYSISINKEKEKQYTDALIRNFEYYYCEEIDSIYFGGGTPSILSNESYSKIFSAISKNFKLISPEITLEANPCSVDYKKLSFLKSIGFTRISFGVQSCVDNELKQLGRIHNFEQARNSIFNAKNAGFKNISADLMLGIPKQTKESLSCSISELSKLPLTHISAYILKIEKNTPFNNINVINSIPNEDEVSNLYLQTVEELQQSGFEQYEISNFAKKGYECKHNLKYWRCEEYVGIGPSAHSFFNGKRFAVPNNLDDFIRNERQTEIINEENPRTFEEVAMLALRLSDGLNIKVCNKFNVDFADIIKKAEPLEKAGLVRILDDRICITKEGFLVSNAIISRLV